MSKMYHFTYISYVDSGLRVEINLERFERQFEEAQEWLGQAVLQDSKAYMPVGGTGGTGGMAQRSKAVYGGRQVVYPGPYARFQYGGKVMVDPVTKSPWARKGVNNKELTDRPLTYTSPTATSYWFDTAKAAHGEYWIAEVKRRAGGGK